MNRKNVITMAGLFVLGLVGGAGLMLNNTAYNAVKQAVGGESTVNAVGNIQGAAGTVNINVQSMDLETAMMAVQSNRANLLEEQLKTQIEEVQKKNKQIASLNDLLAALKSIRPANANDAVALSADITSKFAAAGVTAPTAAKLKQGEIDKQMDTIRGQIDSMSNSQQMDMLRLQSLSNKRNEAFDLMTNFIKKMADSRSSVIGNMR
ncbi:hypothetical protein ACFQZT_09935 [Paenibacillus sp. GCM10027628]|uniref:hypothetical protein n=1 Tax=Paenibacillus sp. GCM10027628 TaxID=3273413 RepID=UPI003632452E